MTISTTKGFSLIEVLVALVVLSIGLLGLASMQIQAMKYNTDAYLRTQATTLAYDIMDRMRANNLGASAGYYQASAAPGTLSVDCDSSNCNSSQLASYDLYKWYTAISQKLPASTTVSSITSAGSQHTITIRWMEREMIVSQSWQVWI